MIRVNDQLNMSDKINDRKPLWVKTEIIGGYDPYVDKYGVTQLGEELFKDENMVTIGGVQYAMEKIFNVSGPNLHNAYL